MLPRWSLVLIVIRLTTLTSRVSKFEIFWDLSHQPCRQRDARGPRFESPYPLSRGDRYHFERMTHDLASRAEFKNPLREWIFGWKVVELSGYRPPSPRCLTGAFSRLSFGFVLIERTPRNAAYRSLQILNLARASNRARVPARICDRSAEWFGPTLCVR